MKAYRQYLRNPVLSPDEKSDQEKGLPIPPIQKPYAEDGCLIDLHPPQNFSLGRMPLIEAIRRRASHRIYTDDLLSLEELSFLLWATQGVRGFKRNGLVTLRTVPSGGSLHPFETYLLINRVVGVEPGVYRYLAIEHKLFQEHAKEKINPANISEICYQQYFVGKAAVVFIWSVRPYRTEWRYTEEDSLKDILISIGHVCQNLYLACESIGAGTCAILAYQQDALDDLIGVDGDEEITLYLAPVGKIVKGSTEE